MLIVELRTVWVVMEVELDGMLMVDVWKMTVVGAAAPTVIVLAKIPRHEQADEYFTTPEHADAYLGGAGATCLAPRSKSRSSTTVGRLYAVLVEKLVIVLVSVMGVVVTY